MVFATSTIAFHSHMICARVSCVTTTTTVVWAQRVTTPMIKSSSAELAHSAPMAPVLHMTCDSNPRVHPNGAAEDLEGPIEVAG